MKKLLLLISALALTIGLTACNFGGGDDPLPGLESVALSGLVDVEIEAGDSFNALTAATALGSDAVDY